IPVPPPPEIDWAFVDQLKSIGVQVRPVPGVPDLMHHKYVVRDAASVLTGSTNWTNDSWNREENVLFTVDSGEVAAAYAQNFNGLWDKPVVAASGRYSVPWLLLSDATRVRPFFCPLWREALDTVCEGKCARLHAREDPGGGRLRVRGQLQPLAQRRKQRRERDPDRERGDRADVRRLHRPGGGQVRQPTRARDALTGRRILWIAVALTAIVSVVVLWVAPRLQPTTGTLVVVAAGRTATTLPSSTLMLR